VRGAGSPYMGHPGCHAQLQLNSDPSFRAISWIACHIYWHRTSFTSAQDDYHMAQTAVRNDADFKRAPVIAIFTMSAAGVVAPIAARKGIERLVGIVSVCF
jgi:hypothetical protein